MNTGARDRTLLALILLAHALLAGAYSVWNPLAEAPDEADHFAYVRYLAAERSLPVGARVTQSKHPPLYHATAAVASFVGDPLDYEFLRANPDASVRPVTNWSPNFFIHTILEDWPWRNGPLAFHAARLWSVLLSTLTVLATYLLVRTGFPAMPGLALTAAGVLAVLPEFAFIGGSVNNDNGAALTGTLILWGALSLYQYGGRWQAAWWTPLAMGLGLLVKISTVALWPTALLGTVLGAARTADDSRGINSWTRSAVCTWRQWAITSIAFLAISLATASPWLIRNWRLYGDPLGYALTQQTVDVRTSPWTMADTVWLLRGWFQSFWGKFGAAGHIPLPSWTYWSLAAISLFSMAGLVRVWLGCLPRYRPIVLLLVLSVVSVALGIWRYSLVALGTDQGRLLFPAVGSIVTLFVLGLAALTPKTWHSPAAIAGIAALAALSVYGLVGVIRPAFAPPPALGRAEMAAGAQTLSVRYGPLHLVGWEPSHEPALYWQAWEATDADWRVTFRVVAEDGSLVWEWRRSPGYGRWSTDRWPVHALLRDEYVISWPDWAGPGRYRVEVGAQPYGGEPANPSVNGEAVTGDSHPYYFLGWIERP